MDPRAPVWGCGVTLVVVLWSVVSGAGASPSKNCVPEPVAPSQLTDWAHRLSLQDTHQDTERSRLARHVTDQDGERMRLPRQAESFGVDVLVNDTACHPQNLCHPFLHSPRVCYYNRQSCDGVENCATGRDELYCHDCLCPYRVVNGVTLADSETNKKSWAHVNLKACARVCNDIEEGCVAFSFRKLHTGNKRCVLYFSNPGKWVTEALSDLYIRDSRSQPRLLAPTEPEPQPQLSCAEQNLYNCKGQQCISYEQVCDGIRHCKEHDEEVYCPIIYGIYGKQTGATISPYSVVEAARNAEACAAYCFASWKSADEGCQVFSYVPSLQECRVDCGDCSDEVAVLSDLTADYYFTSFDSIYRAATQLLQIQAAKQGATPRINRLKASFSSVDADLSARGYTVPPASTSKGSSAGGPTSVNVPQLKPTATSQSVLASTVSTSPAVFQTTAAASVPVTPSPQTATPPLATALPAECGRRPLAALAASDRQQTQARVLQSSDPANRLVSGHRASAGTYPWQAQIQAYNPAGFWEHHCGAVLIGPQHVLTAAHCVLRSIRTLQVILGQHDRRIAGEPHEQAFSVENALVHPDYRREADSAYANDIAVLKLRPSQGRQVLFSSHVRPLCLPAQGSAPPQGPCEISGWGKTDPLAPSTDASAAAVLHGGVVPLVSDFFCAANEVYGARFLSDRMVCAGYVRGGTDACQGDSGGPLACQRPDGAWEVSGIVSFGTGCGGELRPGVYTRVSYFVSWIQRVVQVL